MLTAREMEKLLYRLGFSKVRQRGSHAFYKHPDGRTTTVPHHQGKCLVRPLTRSILRDIKLEIDDFNKLLED